MKRKGIFGSISFLIVAVLISAALFKGEIGQYITIGVISLWCVFELFRCLYPKIKAKQRKNTKAKKSAPERIVFPMPDIVETPEQILMRHVNFRITDKLKSAYPQATWDWVEEKPINLALNGGCGRIKTQNTDEFNFADVSFCDYANIEFKMLKVVGFPDVVTATEDEPDRDDKSTSEGYDVASWYSIIAEKKLAGIITELNAKGHKSLFIHEDGSIYLSESELEAAVETLSNMPKKSYWEELREIISTDGLKTSNHEKTLKLEW